MASTSVAILDESPVKRTPHASSPTKGELLPDIHEPTPPSSDEKTSVASDKLETNTPPPPLLAYDRGRSFLKPGGKQNYELTFQDATTAREWWSLVQAEYPDVQKETSQLLSFKSDRLPSKALQNPRLSHLKDKWSFRVLDATEGNTPDKTTIRPNLSPTRPSKRESLLRMISSPSVGHQRRDTVAPKSMMLSPSLTIDDPFTQSPHHYHHHHARQQPTPPDSIHTFDLTELNRSLDRMHMLINQTSVRIDALSARQTKFSENMTQLQSCLEANSVHIQALASQGSEGAISTRNLRAGIEQNAKHIGRVLDVHERALGERDRLANRLDDFARRIDQLTDAPRMEREAEEKNHEVLRRIEDGVRDLKGANTTAREKVPDGLDAQVSEKLASISTRLDDISIAVQRCALPSPPATDEVLQRIQDATAKQSEQIIELVAADQATKEVLHTTLMSLETRLQATSTQQIEQITNLATTTQESQVAIQTALTSLSSTPARAAMTEKTFTRRIKEMQAAHDTALERMRADMETLVEQRVKAQMEEQARLHAEVLRAVGEMTRPVVVQCGHIVAPPPRKVGREVQGFWYK